MPTPELCSLLMAERDKLLKAIQLFPQPHKPRGRRPLDPDPIFAYASRPSPILEMLTAEYLIVARTIEVLGLTSKRRGRPPKNPLAIPSLKRRGRPPKNREAEPTAGRKPGTTKPWSAERLKAHSERMKQRWAAKRTVKRMSAGAD
jgi:hypothetical protein